VPNGAADTPTFALSNTTNVSISANTEVNGITFTAAATNPYTITANPGLTLTISGVGITNNSGTTQNFVTAVNGAGNVSQVFFANSATAGSSTLFTNNGSATFGMFGGQTQFFNTASASNGTFINNGGTAGNALGGRTIFRDSSTAAKGTFTNNGTSAPFAAGGVTQFYDTSTAANGTFTNNGAGFGPGGFDGIGHTDLLGSSTAANGTFINNGGTVSGAAGGQTDLAESSTAAHGTFINNGATVSGAGGGLTTVLSTAANGTFINNGGTVTGAEGGFTEFSGGKAANATVINNGATASGAGGGFTQFFRGTVASGTVIFTNNGATVSGAEGGFTQFFGGIVAPGALTFINNSATVTGAGGGFTQFFRGTATNATSINNGATVSGAEGGFTELHDSSNAGGALIANGGTGGGGGGTILFLDDSTASTARVEVFGNGSLDISLHNAPGMTINSIGGDGNVFLGSNKLTVGSDNLNTTFACAIQDGGQSGRIGGSLTKIGTGTLDLTGANTYSGNTNINGGALKVDGSIASNTFINHSGTLAGMGMVHGNVTNKNGGTVSPGDAPGTLTVNSYTQMKFGTLVIDIAGPNTGQFSVLNDLGTANLDGILEPVLLSGFIPTVGESFTFMNYASLFGEFSTIKDLNFDNMHWSVAYQPTYAVLTAEAGRAVPDLGSTLLLMTLSLLGLVAYRRQLFRAQP
jgi:autotransporter-associated beta strand protein